MQGVLALTALTVIQIVTGNFQKLSLWKANKVPEVTENSRPFGALELAITSRVAAKDAECGQTGSPLVWDQRNWQLGFILVNLITGRDGPTSACCSASMARASGCQYL